MPEPKPPTPLTLAQRIDRLGDRFEADWRAGKKPRLEDFLAPASASERGEILRHLLLVELELLAKQGVQPDPAAYRSRFPDQATVVTVVFQELARKRGVADTSVNQTAAAATVSGPGQPAPSPAPPAPSPSPPAVPAVIGRFQVKAVLGQGAFGTVYHAHDPQLDRAVAIKVPRPGAFADGQEAERFLREARAAATLHHPNVCPVYEAGQLGDSLFLVMAYVPGKSLAAFLAERKEPLPPRQAALIARKIAQGLEAAHAKGIVHRDLKPANVMLDLERKEPVVMDFGLARRVKSADAQITHSGVLMGTPAYMAPEQAGGDARAAGPAADVYALGVILYEMLAGRRPFEGSLAEVLGQILYARLEPPSSLRPGLDARLEAICLKAMARDPKDRYRSMKELADALADWVRQADGKPRPGGTRSPAAAAVEGSQGGGLTTLFNILQGQEQRHASRARTQLLVLCGGGLLGLLALAALGIMLFIRTPTVTVIVHLEGVDLKDPALSFFLDEEPVSAAQLEKPIDLTLGEHTLLVQRGAAVVKKFRFTINKGANTDIRVREEPVEAPAPPAPTPPPPAVGPVVFTELKRWEGHNKFLQAVAIAPDGRSAVAADHEGVVIHWSLPDGKELQRLGTPGAHVAGLALTPDGQAVLFGGLAKARLWRLGAKRAEREFDGLAATIATVAVTPDGRTGLAAGKDGAVTIAGWELATGKPAFSLKGHGGAVVWNLAVAPDGSRALSVGADGTARIWDLAAGKELHAFPATPVEGSAAAFCQGGKRVLVPVTQTWSLVRLWDPDTRSAVRDFRHGGTVRGLALLPDGKRFLTVSEDRALRLWELDTGRELGRAEVPEAQTCVAVAPDGRHVLTGGGDRLLRLWRIDPAGVARPAADAGFVSLFNGKDLSGWHVAAEDGTHIEPAKSPWRVRDGEVFFSLSEGAIERFNLTSEREYADFRLRFEFQADDKIRAGVRIRADKDATKRQGSGMVWIGDTFPFLKTGYFMYAPQSKQHLVPDSPPQLRPAGEWNVMEIDALGQRQQVFINGQRVLDFDREELSKRPLAMAGLTRPQGVIKFLGSAGTMRLRHLAVKELKPGAAPPAVVPAPAADAGFVPLFNGKDLTGWKTHPEAPGNWRVENGVLIGQGEKPNHLFTERGDFTDLHVRVEAKIGPGGNSGVSVRAPFEARPGVGYEANIAGPGGAPRTGSLFVKGGAPAVAVQQDLVPADTWFTLDHMVQGNRIVIRVNDKEVVDYTDAERVHERGHIALQMHHAGTVVQFRKVEVKELPPARP